MRCSSSNSIHLCLANGPNLAAGACRVALGRPVTRQPDFLVGLRALYAAGHLLSARERVRFLDPRCRAPDGAIADKLLYAAACAAKLRAGRIRQEIA